MIPAACAAMNSARGHAEVVAASPFLSSKTVPADAAHTPALA
jgi:hypothetical protein